MGAGMAGGYGLGKANAHHDGRSNALLLQCEEGAAHTPRCQEIAMDSSISSKSAFKVGGQRRSGGGGRLYQTGSGFNHPAVCRGMACQGTLARLHKSNREQRTPDQPETEAQPE